MIFGICFLGAFVEGILSQFLDQLKKVITPIVTGIVITTIGLYLIKVGMTDLGGGFGAKDYGSLQNIGVGFLTLLVVILVNRFKNQHLRMSAIMIGLAVGSVVAWSQGMIDFSGLKNADIFAFPIPFKYGFDFDFGVFIPIALIFIITTIEAIGDLTANSMVSNEPVSGPIYMNRIKRGILGDAFNSLLAATFNTWPNTTFSQNNGVIQLTGVASRYVAYYIAGMLVFLGLFPIIGAVFMLTPKPVLGGITLIMFGTAAARLWDCVLFSRKVCSPFFLFYIMDTLRKEYP